MKIKLLTLTTLTLSFLLSAPPTAWSDCYVPDGSSREWITEDKCTCEEYGFILNYKDYWGDLICMDRHCLSGYNTGSDFNDVKCQACKQGFYISGSFCKPCPSGATCDGYKIFCSDGYYNDGSGCSSCHYSCATCEDKGDKKCTSCDSGKFLSDGQCVDCPAHAVCDGSSYFSCATGYIKSDGECVKEEQEPTKTNTVNTCPSRMTLSADGCCCVNK